MDASRFPERQEHVRRRLEALAARPPQSLVLEGGTAAEREALALFWVKRLNCGAGGCGQCETCRQIDERVFRDLHFFHGGPGAGESITIEMVRELRPVWGQPPHGTGQRVTVFHGAQYLGLEAANALLKTLEEPRPGNVFVLTAPQRERLLPTLVSRSFILTLAWPLADAGEPETAEWREALLGFWESGRGWFGRTMAKGSLDRDLAQRVLVEIMRVLALALSGEQAPEAVRLARLFDAPALRRLDLALAQGQEALAAQVNPALVLDWIASRPA